ncbi:MAG: hypothetical protein KJ060_01110 [Candidatus Hydrogenedentes bacterium]|nr:hypothetical protein [Candidatus Hydrogenedentota bacterium]
MIRLCLAISIVLFTSPVAISAAQESAASIDRAQLETFEASAKAWVDFLLRAQVRGALPVQATVDSDTGDVVPFTDVVNDDSASDLGKPFIWAYRIWGDPRYLDGAKALADFYIDAQFPEGGWTYGYTLQPDGGVAPVTEIANFEEWVQSNGLRHLAAVYHLTGEEKYKDAAVKAGEVILRAQDHSGWWPWGAQVGDEDRRPDYLKGPTLNDWNLNACIGDCLVLFDLTGDRRYLDAVRKAGEWIISAQIEGPTPGWAAQYDTSNVPRWARYMEPPAADLVFGTYGAGSALLMLYDMTGDDRYLAPLRPHLAWLQSIPEPQKGWMWYAYRNWTTEENVGKVSDYTQELTARFGGTLPPDEALQGIAIEAGEPIIAYHYQMVPVDHPEMDHYLTPLNGHYGSRSENAESWLQEEMAKRADGPIVPGWNGDVPASNRAAARPTKEACAAAYDPVTAAQLAAEFEQWRAGEAESTLVEEDGESRKVHVGRGCARAIQLLRQIALARAGLGETPPGVIPAINPSYYFGDFALVHPERDWYAIGLRAAE